jgi:hypothetical protein
MTIQGSRQRILDSVLPHEITHTIFATHFGRPLPRWADEGACTTVEHESERGKQDRMLITFLTTGRGIAFNRMFAMKEYPQDILPLYSQGYSLARFLIAQSGRRKFVQYVADGMNYNWTAATKKHYGLENLSELQLTWLDWVRRGCPPLQPKTGPPAPSQEAAAITLAASRGEGVAPAGSLGRQPRDAPLEGPASDLVPVPQMIAAAPTPLAAVEAPAPAQASEAPRAGEGWYARQRDLALADRGSASGPADRVAMSTDGPPGSDSSVESVSNGRHVTRPQPVGRPQQIVLEWSRPPAQAAPATPIQTLPHLQTPPPLYHGAPAGPTGTVWR